MDHSQAPRINGLVTAEYVRSLPVNDLAHEVEHRLVTLNTQAPSHRMEGLKCVFISGFKQLCDDFSPEEIAAASSQLEAAFDAAGYQFTYRDNGADGAYEVSW